MAKEYGKLKGPVLITGDFNDSFNSPALQPIFSFDLTDIGGQVAEPSWTIKDGSKKRRFDYILASPAMAKRYVKNSATVARSKKFTSDHAAVYADFQF